MLLSSKPSVFISLFLVALIFETFANERICNGFVPVNNVWAKHMVSIREGSPTKFFGDNHICGGTIISKNAVITAAHCLFTKSGKKKNFRLLLVAGSPFLFDTFKPVKSYKTKKEIIHPTYSPNNHTSRADFALLITKKNFDENDLTIQRIFLMDEEPEAGLNCTALGWGRIFPNGPRSDELVAVNLKILSPLVCDDYYKMNPSVICAGDKYNLEKGVWKGDSGGPLICNGKLTGIISFGYYTAGYNYYVNAYEYREWIHEMTNLCSKFENLLWLLLISIFVVV